MTTEVILTGTGIPNPAPGRAGAGTLVRCGATVLQFDAGRGTVMRLADAGLHPFDVTALLLTHVHSDHVEGVPDLAMTRWIEDQFFHCGPLVVVAPAGPPARFVERMFDPFEDDIALRVGHVQDDPPSVDLRPFEAAAEPVEVWRTADGSVRVSAVLVHHEPVEPAVAYRVETPDGAVVISGDTRACDEVEALSAGADVLVHEACRASALAGSVAGTPLEAVFSYHADSIAVGTLAERAGVGHLMLTHLIPQPASDEDGAAYEADVRAGGYRGTVTVGTDLARAIVDGRNERA
jgi:ribonuclease Z